MEVAVSGWLSLWRAVGLVVSKLGFPNLFAAFLEHVLLLLGHHLPLLAAQHHALRARDILHVHHQLSAVQGVAVPEGPIENLQLQNTPRTEPSTTEQNLRLQNTSRTEHSTTEQNLQLQNTSRTEHSTTEHIQDRTFNYRTCSTTEQNLQLQNAYRIELSQLQNTSRTDRLNRTHQGQGHFNYRTHTGQNLLNYRTH